MELNDLNYGGKLSTYTQIPVFSCIPCSSFHALFRVYSMRCSMRIQRFFVCVEPGRHSWFFPGNARRRQHYPQQHLALQSVPVCRVKETATIQVAYHRGFRGYVIQALFLFRLDSFQKSHRRNRHLRENHKNSQPAFDCVTEENHV